MTKDEFMGILDRYLEITEKVAGDKNLIISISKEIEANSKVLAQLKDELVKGFPEQKPVEDLGPNVVPVHRAPAAVTDMKKVKEDLRVWKNAVRVCLRNRVTQEEREFPSKNKASQFLGVSYPKMNDILLTDGTWGDWSVTMIEGPSADTPGA